MCRLVPQNFCLIVYFRYLRLFFFFSLQDSSLADVDEGFNDVQQELERLYLDHKEVLGPYIVIFNKELHDVSEAYLIVGTHRIKFDSLFNAVDACFKIFKTLC